jgi:hypothetical protein
MVVRHEMAQCQCPSSWGWGGPGPPQYPYCPVHNPMRAHDRFGVSGFTTTGPIPPPRDGEGYYLRPASQDKGFPCGWDERDAKV